MAISPFLDVVETSNWYQSIEEKIRKKFVKADLLIVEIFLRKSAWQSEKRTFSSQSSTEEYLAQLGRFWHHPFYDIFGGQNGFWSIFDPKIDF